MKKLLFLILIVVISCSKDKENNDENCIDELDNNQRLKLFQITLQYTVPRVKITSNKIEDIPLFID